MTEKILFIGGSLNQTKMMHKISSHLGQQIKSYFSPYYADGLEDRVAKLGLLESTVLGGRHQKDTLDYLERNQLTLDWRGDSHTYDLVVTGSDLLVQKNIRNTRLVLVQEGITEPEKFIFHLVKRFKLPRYLANTSTTGLSDLYDIFCVASKGYREHFIRIGVNPEKIVITGIPNFDNFKRLEGCGIPLKNYVLVATSPQRETFRIENRKRFLKQCERIAAGRLLVFKLHPLEKVDRAKREIEKHCPGAIVLVDGDVDRMIASAAEVITQTSSCTFTAVALKKKVHTYLNEEELKYLMPVQNNGASAKRISKICRYLLTIPVSILKERKVGFRSLLSKENID